MIQRQKSVRLYNLSQFAAFAGDDPENLRQILASFVSSGLKNTALLRQSLDAKNLDAVSELAHKMLPLFRMLQTKDIVSLLDQLERKNMEAGTYFSTGESVHKKIDEILQILQDEENISLN